MRSTDPDAVYAALRAADPDVMDRDQLAETVRLLATHKGWCDALQVRVARRQRQLAAEGRAEAPKDLLSREGGQSGKDARATDEREQVCTALPNFEHALAAGSVSAGHVDAIAGAIRILDEQTTADFLGLADDLLSEAEQHGVDVFDRTCRDLARQLTAMNNTGSDSDELERQRQRSRIKRWTDRETGMRCTLLELDPIRDAKFWAAIDRERRKLRRKDGNGDMGWDQLQVEAVLAAVSGGEPGERVVELSVLVDLDTLQHGLHDEPICELSDGTPLPVSTVQAMACEAEIIPILVNSDGRPLKVGRAARLATPAQRQALRAMHRTCVHPDCTVPFDDCRIHHIVPWEHGGTTDLDNLAPVCESAKHHQLIHDRGWTLTMTPDRVATWTRPDGQIYWTGSTIDRIPHTVKRSAA